MLMQDSFAFVSGVANHRSIAWAIAKSLDAQGARLARSASRDGGARHAAAAPHR